MHRASARTSRRVAFVVAGALAAAPAAAGTPDRASATLRDGDGNTVGQVTLRDGAYGAILTIGIDGLPPGVHAFHVHETGKCEPPFKSAGGHFNPTGTGHGIGDRDGMHAGDLPNLHVPESGRLELEYFAPAVHVDAMLLDGDGAALVVHQGPDDYASDPAGAAGPRIACGVIEAP